MLTRRTLLTSLAALLPGASASADTPISTSRFYILQTSPVRGFSYRMSAESLAQIQPGTPVTLIPDDYYWQPLEVEVGFVVG